MFLVLRLLIVAALGAGLGLGSVKVALDDVRLDFTPRIGPWQVTQGAGSTISDPYVTARAARRGVVGLGPAEGVAFVARSDSAGRPLDGRCHYVVEGPIPPGDLWTLAVTDGDGRPPRNPANRIGFTSREVVLESDGRVVVGIGPTARPGNFVPAGGLADLVVTLRVYSPRLAAELPAEAGMPLIRLAECPGGAA